MLTFTMVFSAPLMSKMQALRKLFPSNTNVRNRMLLAMSSSTAEPVTKSPNPNPSTSSAAFKDEGEEFRYLLRHSSFVNLGDPEDKIVTGTIFQVVNDDLYVDLGWKFYCVCARPTKGGERYVRGATVLLRLKTLEMSSKFLGAEKALTLLEAEASIVKLLSSPTVQT